MQKISFFILKRCKNTASAQLDLNSELGIFLVVFSTLILTWKRVIRLSFWLEGKLLDHLYGNFDLEAGYYIVILAWN